MNADRNEVDIAIVGGGLVGASLACALAPLGLKIAVIEKVAPRAQSQPSYDDRTLALSDGSSRILNALGLWPGLSQHATPIREILVSERGRPGRVLLKAAESGVAAFGQVVEARNFGATVMQQIETLPAVQMICPATVTAVQNHDSHVELQMDVGGESSTLGCALLVAADGADSAVRQMLKVPVDSHDYEHTAIVCNVTPEHAHGGRAFERLTETGPFAVLPHQGQRCGLVWSATSAQAEQLLQLSDADFLQAAQQRFGMDLGRFERIGRRSAYPLRRVRARQDVHPRCVILGNAAHTIHPIGAQGFNLGLRDVAVLAEVLADAQAMDENNFDPGAAQHLAAYSAWRRPDQDRTEAWTDGLARLFANPSALAGGLRSVGLLAHAWSLPLRRRLASSAMGYHGRVPRLALGDGPMQVVQK